MNKGSTVILILSSLAIICLLGLAGFLTVYMKDASSAPQSSVNVQTEALAQVVEPGETITTKSASGPCYGDEDYVEPEHSFLFVGDSRTVGMRDAVTKNNSADTCTYIAKSGEGFYWFYNDGIVELEEALKATPDATVIFNLGVNDLKEADKYIAFYQELFSVYKDPSFYIMSVNPVDDEQCEGASNEEIQAFNEAIQEAFPDKYLDCYSYLLSEDFKTVDGLHYPDSIYCKIHHFAVMILKK